MTDAGQTAKNSKSGLFAGLLALGYGVFKYKAVLLSVFKFGWLSHGFWTMLLSLWLYTMVYGWKFAVAMIAMLLVHEGGHWIAMKYYGLEPKAPMFVPFFGAYVAMTKMPKDEYVHAWVAFAGPFAGGLFGFCTYGLGVAMNNTALMAGGAFGCMLNLLQLIPFWIFDGKFIVAVMSKWALIPTTIIFAAIAFYVHSPLLFAIAAVAAYATFRRFVGSAKTSEKPLPSSNAKTIGELEKDLVAAAEPSTAADTSRKESPQTRVLIQQTSIAVSYVLLAAALCVGNALENDAIKNKMKAEGIVLPKGQSTSRFLMK